jgi:alpha-glucosidase
MVKAHWWQNAVFYQIYPRSFADGNGDGIGDLQGIIEHLDYLRDLGIDGIWLSPHYPSPLFDAGYDVADYTGVAPEYGTLDTFQHFLAEAHAREIRVILDLVLNHTSDQHTWFQESRSGRDNPRRDWYIWKDGKDGGPPNNWLSTFGGSAWQYDPTTDQYYYHFFFKEQPDLNWRNPEVKQAMWDAVRFWLDRGVDGFRLDAISTIFEDPTWADNADNWTEGDMVQAMASATGDRERARLMDEKERLLKKQLDQPGLHELMKELRAVCDTYPGRVLVGETDDLAFCGTDEDELHMVFNFPLMRTARLTPQWVRENQECRLNELPPAAWPCNTLGNHDNSRVLSHFGDDTPAGDQAWARISAGLMLTLQGTPFLYYGEEIGMADMLLEDVGQFRDMLGVWYYRALIEHLGYAPEEARRVAGRFTRDKSRTPMQWNADANAGFSPAGVTTWLPVHPGYREGTNVAGQDRDPQSLLNFYRCLLALRRRISALRSGTYESLGQVDPQDHCLAFLRRNSEQTCLVVLNVSDQPHTLDLRSLITPHVTTARPIFACQARDCQRDDLSHLDIAPYEVYIAEV